MSKIMHKRLAIVLIGVMVSAQAQGVEFAARLIWSDFVGYRSVHTIDSDSADVDEIHTISVPTFFRAIAAANDGRIFVATRDVERDADDARISVLRIIPLAAERNLSGDIEYTEEDPLFELSYLAEDRDTEPITQIAALAVKTIDDAGNYQVYFSTACGSCADGQIYYVDDMGVAQPYYRVRLSDLVIPSCEGSGGYWGGDFVFDDSNNLYLSSGNHVPASLYTVDGAGADEVTGTPEWLRDRVGSIEGMDFDSDALYFVGSAGAESQNIIYSWDASTFAESEVFSDPTIESINAVAVLHTPAMLSRRLLSGSSLFQARLYPGVDIPRNAKLPDLRIASVEANAPSFTNRGRTASIPLRFSIENAGTKVGNAFDTAVTISFAGESKSRPVPFIMVGNEDEGVFSSKRFQAGGQLGVAGEVELESPDAETLYEREVTITVNVDSCVGDGAMPDYCRVKESNERNNAQSIRLTLRKRLDTD